MIYGWLERSSVYAWSQRLGEPTTRRFRELIALEVSLAHEHSLLDFGCGVGNYRESFACRYTGIDINPRYVELARRRFADDFRVMDCTRLDFEDESFDAAITIATTHHLDDDQLAGTIAEALRVVRVGGVVHVIDAILPLSPISPFKFAWFKLDRGRHARTLKALATAIGRVGHIERQVTCEGPLHDVAYFSVTRPES